MNDVIIIVLIIEHFTILSILLMWLTSVDGFLSKRKLNKYLSDIEYYQRDYDNKKIEIEYKDKSFIVNVDTQRHTNYFKSMMLYINEELALTLHILEGDMAHCRVIRFCNKRYYNEIIEIAKATVKISRKRAIQNIEERYHTLKHKSYFK